MNFFYKGVGEEDRKPLRLICIQTDERQQISSDYELKKKSQRGETQIKTYQRKR